MLIYLFLRYCFYIILFIISLVRLIFNRKHILLTLIGLEFIVLILFGLIFIFINEIEYEYYWRLIFLTFSVCESSLGLAILVSLIRTHGNDYFQSFNIIQC